MSEKSAKPVLEMTGGKGPRQRIWEAIRSRRHGFTRVDIAVAADMEVHSARKYLTALLKGGYIAASSATPRRVGAKVTYALVRDTGLEAPRLNHEGALLPPTSQELMWRTMRMLGEFDCPQLVSMASTPEVSVALTAAQDYLKHLAHAGYITLTQPGYPARHTYNRYRFNAARYTGPRPPRVLVTKIVYDPNLDALAWREEINHDI